MNCYEVISLLGDVAMEVKIAIKELCLYSSIRYPDIEINAGEIVFLSGPSGCGKSSLLRACNGTLTPTAGYVYLDGINITSLDPVQLRRRVLLAGQNPYLFRSSIRGNFSQFFSYRDEAAPTDEVMTELLTLCQVPFPLDGPCDSLSGGERQRVFLALALSMAPDVLLLDEPHSAMDSDLADTVLSNMLTYARQRGMTVIIISHDEALRDKHADRIIRLEGKP
jgi:putative ABC transport system ATP-binding protein